MFLLKAVICSLRSVTCLLIAQMCFLFRVLVSPYSQQKAELLDRSSSHIADSKRKIAHRLQIAVFQNIV